MDLHAQLIDLSGAFEMGFIVFDFAGVVNVVFRVLKDLRHLIQHVFLALEEQRYQISEILWHE